MYLPVVLPYPDFLKKIKPIIGSDIKFLYTREPDCKKWKFESLYICMEDTIEDRKLYVKKGIDVDFRDKPTPGERLEVEELNENLEDERWGIIRFIEQECDRCENGFILTVEIRTTAKRR